MVCAAAVEMPESSTSVVVSDGDASYPALIDTNATIAPSAGLRPAALNTRAPSGIRVTYAASPATCPTIAVIASANVR